MLSPPKALPSPLFRVCSKMTPISTRQMTICAMLRYTFMVVPPKRDYSMEGREGQNMTVDCGRLTAEFSGRSLVCRLRSSSHEEKSTRQNRVHDQQQRAFEPVRLAVERDQCCNDD